MPFKDFIDQLEEIPLNGDDLVIMSRKLGNPNTYWILYEDLIDITDIDQLFLNNKNTVYILLEINNNRGSSIGHWICLIKYGNNQDFEYAHYDSYGLDVDEELHFTHAKPLLNNLVKGVRLDESRVRHQAFSGKKLDINTCGRHTVFRAIFYYLNNREYDKLIVQPVLKHKDVKDLDVLVAVVTAFLQPDDDIVRQFFMNKSLSGGAFN